MIRIHRNTQNKPPAATSAAGRTAVAAIGLGFDTGQRRNRYIQIAFATDILSELYRQSFIAPLEGRIIIHARKRYANLKSRKAQ
jgi:hypothetical protein